MLTRRLPAAALVAVVLATLWSLLLGGPVVAQEIQTSAIVQTQVSPAFQAPPAYSMDKGVTKAAADLSGKQLTAASKTEAPEGSPLYVRLIMIAVLLVLGVGYFRLMSHSGRRLPKVKQQSDDAELTDKQPANAG